MSMFSPDVQNLLAHARGITYGEVLETQARAAAHRIALEYAGHVYTYAQLNAMANQCAWRLLELGVSEEVPISVLSDNSLDYVVLMYAAAKVGVPLAGINWRLAPVEMAAAMAVVRPSLAFVSAEFSDRLSQALKHYAPDVSLPRVVTFDPLRVDDRRVELSAALSHEKSNDPKVDVEPERVMLIVYTSGTTGTPKGAALSHRSELARASIMSSELQLTANDSYVAWAPLFHMSSTDYMLLTHGRGGKVLLLPKFDTLKVAEFLTREKVGWLLLMPGILDSLTEAIKAQGLPIKGVRHVGCMADLSPIASIRNVTEVLGGAGYFNTFGTTEIGTIPGAWGSLDLTKEPISLSKRQTTFCQIRIVDDDGRDVPFGKEGELLVRSPSMFSGYWNNEAATREALRDGWYHTGDICVLNPDGTYDYKGRSKYLIKSGGENIYPAEIEQVLMRHPRIEEAAAIRVPDERWGEVAAAYIALNGGPPVSDEELVTYCLTSLARFKVPKYFISVPYDGFPRNVTGKVERLELEKRFSTDRPPTRRSPSAEM